MYKHIIKQLLRYTYGGGGGGQPNFVYVTVKKPKYGYTKINKNTHGILILLGVETKPYKGSTLYCYKAGAYRIFSPNILPGYDYGGREVPKIDIRDKWYTTYINPVQEIECTASSIIQTACIRVLAHSNF